jgi:tRNA(Ile)-lysidine synthetase-like protein
MSGIIAVAVSGGVDSMVLLDQIYHNKKNNILILYFDHGLRNSQQEIDLINKYSLDRGLMVAMGVNKDKSKTDEDSLRLERWNFFNAKYQEYGFKTLYLGHHRDDYIQTLFFNIVRGVDIDGLFPMNSQLRPYKTIRPLIGLNKEQIYQYAISNHLEWIEDKSNILYSYSRNIIRKIINIDTTKKLDLLDNNLLLDKININSNQLMSILVENRPEGIFFNYNPLLIDAIVLRFLLKKIIKKYFKVGLLDRSILELLSVINKQRPGDKWHSGNITATIYSSEWLRLSTNR